MFKPPVDILLSNQRQGFCQSVREFSFGAGLEGAQGSLELRNAALNGIEGSSPLVPVNRIRQQTRHFYGMGHELLIRPYSLPVRLA